MKRTDKANKAAGEQEGFGISGAGREGETRPVQAPSSASGDKSH